MKPTTLLLWFLAALLLWGHGAEALALLIWVGTITLQVEWLYDRDGSLLDVISRPDRAP